MANYLRTNDVQAGDSGDSNRLSQTNDGQTGGGDHFVIAIDGPSGAGKSTIAKLAAERLGIDYIDTGAMYRAVALAMIRAEEEAAGPEIGALLDGIAIDLAGGRTFLNGEDVTDDIRTAACTKRASQVSQLPEVRGKLVALQRAMGARKSVVMDGRDIASNVFPDARYKFFITASPGERARRRTLEMEEKGLPASYEEVLADIEKRDWDDAHRPLNPLTQTPDAILIVTDGLGIEETLNEVLGYIVK